MGKDRGEGAGLPDSDDAEKIMQDPHATEKCTFCLQLFNVPYSRPALSLPMGSMFLGH